MAEKGLSDKEVEKMLEFYRQFDDPPTQKIDYKSLINTDSKDFIDLVESLEDKQRLEDSRIAGYVYGSRQWKEYV
jgi:hypothetical protein